MKYECVLPQIKNLGIAEGSGDISSVNCSVFGSQNQDFSL